MKTTPGQAPAMPTTPTSVAANKKMIQTIQTKLNTMTKLKEKIVETKIVNNLGNLLYTIAIVLLAVWGIGFLAFNAGALIHVLLVIAIVVILLRVINGRKLSD
ncbi:MAG: lmo0937 family membrane protein [Flavobacteriales bacterium]